VEEEVRREEGGDCKGSVGEWRIGGGGKQRAGED